ncbi:MAG: aminoglycoside phosphotransferase family protein, partial [candidate division KSB1 bacterium]|nr:aminoglycoside phosphotransferase family protein [candidate division KSB1 bacterium]
PEFVGGLFKSKKMRQRLQRWQVQETRMEVLRYVPGKRLTARCTVRMKRDDGDETNISFIAKQLNDGKKAEQSFHTLRALHKVWSSHGFYLAENAAALPAPAPFPRALALNKERAVIFIEELPGKNLAEALTEVDLAQVMPAAGALLAAFHRIPKQVKKRVSRKSELKEVRKALGTIGTAFPELEPRLQKLFGTLCALHWEDNTPMALLHGSLRLNHLVIHEGRLALLDLDSLRLGPPAYDLANLLSSLYYFEAQGRLSRSQRQQITRYFLEGYAAQAAWNLAPRVVLWFLISLLINKQALKYVTHFHPDRAEKVTRMLQQAENILEQGYRQANDSTLSALWQVLP